MRKEFRVVAVLLIWSIAFIIRYTHSPGYYNNRVLTPTLSSYYLQLQALKDYRDPEGFIGRIDVESLDKKNSATDREITVTIRVQMNPVFEYLTEKEAETKLVQIGKTLRRLEQNARDESGLQSALKRSRNKGKILVKDELVMLYVTRSGEAEFPKE
ncbi:MAG: hypothetical protein IJT43_11325 [Stomatobaculum sp.]|nr:hypothetical protein [Stomatobaculum sp.]